MALSNYLMYLHYADGIPDEEMRAVHAMYAAMMGDVPQFAHEKRQREQLHIGYLSPNLTDHIVLNIRGNEKIAALAEKYEELLKNTILSDEIHSESDENREDFTKEWNLNGELVTLSVRRVKAQ